MSVAAGASAATYAIAATASTDLDCPVARASGRPCAGAGACVRALGRCDCDAGAVMDDCSGDGVFALGAGGVANASRGNAPHVAVDDWAYWSVVVGCADRAVDVYLATEGGGSRPRLFVARGKLPRGPPASARPRLVRRARAGSW